MERVFEFHGSDAEYIKYLERKLLEFRPLPSQIQSPNSPPPSPGPANDATLSVSRSQLSPGSRKDDRLQFVHYDPQPRRTSQSQRQWKTDLRKFIYSIPKLDKWDEKRERVGSSTVEANRLAIQIMLGRSSEIISVPENDESLEIPELMPEDNFGMISGACKYGSRTRNSKSNMEFSILLAKYQQLIFISYCVVLLDVGNATETVNWMLRRYVSDSGPKNLMRYRSGCLWVNRCVASLLTQGWGYKSWEIFLLCSSCNSSKAIWILTSCPRCSTPSSLWKAC